MESIQAIDVHGQEKRMLMHDSGFGKFRQKLTFLYECDFKRDKNKKGVYHGTMVKNSAKLEISSF